MMKKFRKHENSQRIIIVINQYKLIDGDTIVNQRTQWFSKREQVLRGIMEFDFQI